MATILVSMSPSSPDFISLYEGNLVPLRTCLAGLTWTLHDYFLTIEDEIRYIWPQKRSFRKYMFFFIRYYTISILLFDVIQIHVFARPGITNPNLCVAMDSIIRVVGAISLWAVEIVMQLRVYALFGCSRKVALFNAAVFALSIIGFFGILIRNAMVRHTVIASAIKLPLPGCPSIHSGLEWAQWVPATAFEIVLFGFALAKSIKRMRNGESFGESLYYILIRDNLLYFMTIASVLLFNNFMVVGFTHIPWFSYAPFHSAVGILTTRMLLSLRKATFREEEASALTLVELQFVHHQVAAPTPQSAETQF
ncbi:hypothetical protein C8J56DRAFT_462526 [Mycena floridula]|nr:hypothetical protein C8J56DRAFT_462526 [Mycena floridula]